MHVFGYDVSATRGIHAAHMRVQCFGGVKEDKLVENKAFLVISW